MLIGLDRRRFNLLDLVLWTILAFATANISIFTPTRTQSNQDARIQDPSVTYSNRNVISKRNDVVLPSRNEQNIPTTRNAPRDLIHFSKPNVSFLGSFANPNMTSVISAVFEPSPSTSRSLQNFYEDAQNAISKIVTTAPVKYISLTFGKLQLTLSCAVEIPWAFIQAILIIQELWLRMGFPNFLYMTFYAVKAFVEFAVHVDLFIVGMRHALGHMERPLVAVIT